MAIVMESSDVVLASEVASRLERLLVGSHIYSDDRPAEIRQADVRPGRRGFLIDIGVTYEFDGQLASITYVADDWSEHATEREPAAIAAGIASLILIFVLEHVETGDY